MAPKTEYDQVCEAVADYQGRLDKLWEKTGSHRHATQINGALRMLQELAWDLERDRPVPGTPWARPASLMHVIALAEEAENKTVKWHSLIGWIWFIVFTIGVLALAGSYLLLHWPEAPQAANRAALGVTATPTAIPAATPTATPTTVPNDFFWKEVPLKYAEIAFWIAAGLLVYILYNIQHYVRDGYDVGYYGQWYFSKILQGVPIGFVIALFFSEFKFAVAGLEADFSTAPMPIFVILAFILGYYSDQSRKYLDVIRKRFFAATDVPEVEIETPREGLSVPNNTVVVRGTVTGAQGMKGTIAVGKGEPMELKLDSSGNFARQIELGKGVNLIRVEATNPNRKVGSKGITVTRSGPGLVLTMTSSLAKAPVHDEILRLEGVLKDDTGTPAPARPVYLLIDQKDPLPTTTDVNGKFAFDVTLSAGNNHIKVVAGQPEGNLTAESVNVTYEPVEKPG